jgi:hypothetical protein
VQRFYLSKAASVGTHRSMTVVATSIWKRMIDFQA